MPPLPQGFTHYRLIGACIGCQRAGVPAGAKPMRLQHYPPGLAAWACRPCWNKPADPAGMMSRLFILEGRDTGLTVTVPARFPEGVR
jgi:hypothetical protein